MQSRVDSIGARVRESRERLGISQHELARRIGVKQPTIHHLETNVARGTKHIYAIAKALGVSADWLQTGVEGANPPLIEQPTIPTLPIRTVPITGAVAAGVWREQVDDLGDPPETIPVSLPGLERATLFAMRVEGQSMNLHYPDGSLVICCPVAEMGARHGDHVIVERRENSLVERSIKELVIETGKARLVPRSSDKRYQAAIDLPRDIHAQNGVAIVAVVVASYMTRVRKPGPALE